MDKITNAEVKENFRSAMNRSIEPLMSYTALVIENYSRFDNPYDAVESWKSMRRIMDSVKEEINRIEEMFEELDK